jgi:hypothetical protein
MPLVIQKSLIITLDIDTRGVSRSIAERATAAIAGEWLDLIERQMVTTLHKPDYQIYVRQMSLAQGAQLQILLCWVVLQTQHQRIADFDRDV